MLRADFRLDVGLLLAPYPSFKLYNFRNIRDLIQKIRANNLFWKHLHDIRYICSLGLECGRKWGM